jgi:Icc-related predicted phosphoesterase
MRILASADIHGFAEVYTWLLEVVRAEKPDGLVLAGDLLGEPDGYGTVEEAQAADARHAAERLAEVDCPVFYIMGNDDCVDLEPLSGSIRSVHEERVAFGSFNVVGYQYTLPFMGGINERTEGRIEEDLRRVEELVDQDTILVTHGPVHGVMDKVSFGGNAGSIALRDLVSRRRPRAHIHGHIHRWFGRKGRHFNVASGGKKRAVLIDLESMDHRILENDLRRS